MDDYIPTTILDPNFPEIIEQKDIMEKVFRKKSIEQNIDINELALNPTYNNSIYKK